MCVSRIKKIDMFFLETWRQFQTYLQNFLEVFNTLRPRQNVRIFQTIFSNAFSWMKMSELRLIFHWNLFLRLNLTIFQHWFRQWLGADETSSHYLNKWWLVYWRVYASLGINELKHVWVSLSLTRFKSQYRNRLSWLSDGLNASIKKTIYKDKLYFLLMKHRWRDFYLTVFPYIIKHQW